MNSPAYLRRSAANKAVRAKQKIVVRTGSKSLAQYRYENRNPITNEPPSLIDEYARLRTYKGEVYPAEAANNHKKMVEMRDAQVGVSNPLTEEEILASVLRPRRGWQTGVGPKYSKSVGSSSTGSQSSKRMYTQCEVHDMMSQLENKMIARTAPLFKALNMQVPDDDGEEEEDEEDDGEDDEEDDEEGDDVSGEDLD